MKKIHIIGGGTFSHIRNHLALAAPAFGTTAAKLYDNWPHDEHEVKLHLTKMADPGSSLVTNKDVAELIDQLVADPDTRVIVMNAALCDYDGSVNGERGSTKSGSHEPRLKTNEGPQAMVLWPADKLIGTIRKTRKDIFVVGFKTTTGATSDEQYLAGLNLLKANSLNLVLANDTVTRNNIVIAPEETRQIETTARDVALKVLIDTTCARIKNTFTRSTVVEESGSDLVPWDSDLIPDNLRVVVDHCIARGAYKPFRGATAGHFAVKVNDNRIITSQRKKDYNKLREVGMVMVDYVGEDRVIAHGGKPSVGGQSQRIVFTEHPELDCIVHFHSPLKEGTRVPVAVQWPYECGSHQCGANTSRNLEQFDDLKAVMLEGHGPNIVFSRTTPPERIIQFIEDNFDLSQKTGGLVA